MAAFSSLVTIHIAMLNADIPVPKVLAKRGSYGNIFHKLLESSATRLFPPFRSGLKVSVTSQDFDVVRGEYPNDLRDFDAILITGSASSSYEENEWIRDLDRYVSHVYENHPCIKIFGSCFGHQMVCQSLLRKYGAVVEKQPSGWELGVYEVAMTESFQKVFKTPVCSESHYLNSSVRPSTPDSEQVGDGYGSQSKNRSGLRMQFIHADHVKLASPSATLPDVANNTDTVLPPNWMVIGKTDKCLVQGVYEPDRVLTYQGHFEFDRFINIETLRVFGAKWDPEFFQNSLQDMDQEDDAEAACDMVLRFLLQGRQTVEEGFGGLMTPPLDVEQQAI